MPTQRRNYSFDNRMNARLFCQLAGRLMRHPAAPYFEHAVRREVEKICAEAGLDYLLDPFGNVLVRLQRAGKQRPLVLTAHLDHPGFEVIRRLSSHRWLVRFRGGVPDNYFRAGMGLRLMPGSLAAKLGRRTGRERVFEVRAAQPSKELPRFAVWELEDFGMRRGRILGRACDDLIGVAATLRALAALNSTNARVNVIGLITRAEEVGLQGALAAAASGELPENALIVSLETSRELPGVKMGSGVILRVGDKTSIFDSNAMRFLGEVAARLPAKEPAFKFQRGLMSGGTCEGTAFQELGYQTGAVCVALGNYHNCAERNRIGAEFVSVSDACGMVDLLVAAALEMKGFERLAGGLGLRLKRMGPRAQPRLRRTALISAG